MASITSAFGGFGSFITLLKYVLIFGAFLVMSLGAVGVVLFVAIKKKQTKIIKIDTNKRIQTFTGTYKKKRGTDIEQFYSRKFKRNLPKFQGADKYSKGTNDALVLYEDHNGLIHSLRVPTYEQLCKWYEVQHGIDLEKKVWLTGKDKGKVIKNEIFLEKLRDVYLAPSPHEDIDWLANQCVEAEKEFKDLQWWQHPNVMIIGACAVAAFIQMINLVIIYLMHK